MPTLDWIGKKAVVNHHRAVPYRLLHCDKALSVGDPGSGNLLIQGDNLLALKALLPYYAGKVKCIYIDPPYNTGNEGWVYNDNVNSPEIRQWLKQVVGKEGEDLSRHDKWLCMMYPRLALLREFLSEDGVIFVSIDENEYHYLRLVLDELFGPACFMETLVWKARQYPDSRATTGISHDHEYVHVYRKKLGKTRLLGRSRDESKYKNPDHDPRGPWMSRSILGLAKKDARPNLHYELEDPKTGVSYPCPANTGWRYSRDTMASKIAEGRILFPKKIGGRPREKVFIAELQTATTGFPSIIDGVYTADGSASIREIFGVQVFAFPKPPTLVQSLIQQAAEPRSLILDSFAGSGTTAHAVLAQNKADGGNRRFICIEMDETICRDVTAQRIRRAIEGYGDIAPGLPGEKPGASPNTPGKPGAKWVEGLGGGFRFCTLGQPLFDEHGNIAKEVTFADLAAHVYFTETGEPIPKRARSPLLGVHNGRAVYLLFNGILGDKRPGGGNVLTHAVAKALPVADAAASLVVYGEACRLSAASLKQYGITFKQVPFALKVD